VAEGLTAELAICSFLVAGIGFLLSITLLHRTVALFCATLKSALPLVYFSWYYDGSWTFLDDVSYLQQGQSLMDAGYGPLSVFFADGGMDMLISMSEGSHILYGWFNLLAQSVIGQHYYAPVLLNVLLTFVAGRYLYAIARVAGMSHRYGAALYFFFLIHWDILAWSSIVNLKDVLVLTLSVALMYSLLLCEQRITPLRSASVLGLIFVFFWIRFYVPLLMLIAFALYWTLARAGAYGLRVKDTVSLAIVSLFVVGYLGVDTIEIYLSRLESEPMQISYGSLRMLLTPQPWSIEPEYAFLVVPSILGLLFLAPAFIGGALLWRQAPRSRFIFIYFGLAILLYGAFEELQGPRHRVQLVFCLAWMQLHSLWVLAVRAKRAASGRGMQTVAGA
jgi:hypothetical protein